MDAFSVSNLRFIIDLRGSALSRLFYNKATLLVNESFKLLDNYSLWISLAWFLILLWFLTKRGSK